MTRYTYFRWCYFFHRLNHAPAAAAWMALRDVLAPIPF